MLGIQHFSFTLSHRQTPLFQIINRIFNYQNTSVLKTKLSELTPPKKRRKIEIFFHQTLLNKTTVTHL